MASGLSKKVTAIEAAIALVAHFSDRLRYLQPTLAALLNSACGQSMLQPCSYLAPCREALRQGEAFPSAWQKAVRQCPGALGVEQAAVLETLGDVLGATDLDSQLTALAWVREQLEHHLLSARQDREKYHKMYSTLGVLCGIAIAIILL